MRGREQLSPFVRLDREVTPDERPLTDQLASAVDAHLREHLWEGPSVTLRRGDDATPFPTLGEDDTAAAGGGEFDVVLRGPGGVLYDVHTHVAVTVREPTAVVDLPQDVARPAYEALAVSVLDSVQIRRGGIRYEVDR